VHRLVGCQSQMSDDPGTTIAFLMKPSDQWSLFLSTQKKAPG
jgi:hypothetical protein